MSPIQNELVCLLGIKSNVTLVSFGPLLKWFIHHQMLFDGMKGLTIEHNLVLHI
jgi:hypothetical protein